MVQVPSQNFPENFLSVTVPSAAAGEVLWNGVQLPRAAFVDIGTSGYAAGHIPVTPGTHTLSTASGVAFGGIAYGWAPFDAYGFPCGLCLPVEGPASTFHCPPDIVVASTTPEGAIVNFPEITFCNSDYQVTFQPPSGSFFKIGTTSVLAAARHPSGAVARCTFNVTVTGPRLVLRWVGSVPTLDFPPGGALLMATDLNGQWSRVTDAVGPYSVPVSRSSRAFYCWSSTGSP
jgi:hypothetical protein